MKMGRTLSRNVGNSQSTLRNITEEQIYKIHCAIRESKAGHSQPLI
jgi:hypothetical protein